MDEYIQPAKGLSGFVEKTAQVIQVAHIRFDQQGTPAHFFDLASGFFARGHGCERS